MSLHAALRAFERPALWLGVWYFGWLLCIVLSLIPPPRVGIDLPDGDKIGHVLAYALLSAWAAWIFLRPRARLWACLGLVVLGIVLELAQGAFTQDRMRDGYDAWADLIGVGLGQLAGLGRGARFLQALEARWLRR